jgi:hypothetical protein
MVAIESEVMAMMGSVTVMMRNPGWAVLVGSARAGPDMVSMVVSLRATDVGRL